MTTAPRTAKLSKKVIDDAKPEVKRFVIWDSVKKGFGIRVETSGLKVFILRYRAGKAGRLAPRREIVLGRCDNWTVEKARTEAGKVLNAVDGGKDTAPVRRP